MWQMILTYRRIDAAELPRVRNHETQELRAANDQELQDLGIVHVRDDVYACLEQLRGSDVVFDERIGRDVRIYAPVGGARLPGTVLCSGDARTRHQRLPKDVRAKVLRASVVRATDPAVRAIDVVESNLLEQATAIEEAVGDVIEPDGSTAALVDFEQPSATVEEAQRLVEVPDSGMVRTNVAMDEIVDGADLVEAENLIPHMWAGERA